MISKKIQINTGSPYTVYVGHHILFTNILLDECENLFNKGYTRLVVVSDSNLPNMYGSDICDFINKFIFKQSYNVSVDLIVINISEGQKNRETKEAIENKLFELNCGRKSCIIAIGGGVLLDMMGFIAATYNRGIPIIYVPTTLLSMVDASVGGKTAINTIYGKNLIGIIKQPSAVLIDSETLKTLPEDDYLSAIAEIIKVAILFDKNLLELLIKYKKSILLRDTDLLLKLIFKSIELKKQVVEQDELENGLRELLNFGHTIGHAIEQSQDYLISHGFAVALGIWVEAAISEQIGILNTNDFNLIQEVLILYFAKKINLHQIDLLGFNQFLMSDKKTKNSKPHYVLIKGIGNFYQENNKYSFAIDAVIENNVIKLVQNNPLGIYNV